MRTRVGWLAAGLGCGVVTGCAGAGATPGATGANAALTATAAPTATAASCVGQTPAQARERAQVIVEAVALTGRSVPESRILLSPARFRVRRYLKGRGPRIVAVQTAVTATAHAGGYAYAEDGLAPRAGQRWLIYGRRTHTGVLAAGICTGSRPLPPARAYRPG